MSGSFAYEIHQGRSRRRQAVDAAAIGGAVTSALTAAGIGSSAYNSIASMEVDGAPPAQRMRIMHKKKLRTAKGKKKSKRKGAKKKKGSSRAAPKFYGKRAPISARAVMIQPRQPVYRPKARITVYRAVPLMLITTATPVATESINGISKGLVTLQVCTNPFVSADSHGTTAYYNSVLYYTDGTNYSAIIPDAGGADDMADIADVCQRYLSVRVAGMRVELELSGGSTLEDDGSASNWVTGNNILEVAAGFAEGDTDPRRSGSTQGTDKRINSDKVKKLKGARVFNHFLSGALTTGAAGNVPSGRPPRRYVLFSKEFAEIGGADTVQQTTGTADVVHSVEAGQWDHRPIYNTTYADAYAVMKQPELRAGKLHISMRFPWGHITGTEGYARDTTQYKLVGFLHTWHTIDLMNDKNTYAAQS